MGQKIRIYHFNNGGGGGVFSVMKTLLQFSTNADIENHVVYTINREKLPHFVTPQLDGAISVRIFYYSPKWNFYYTCKQLAKLLPDDKAIIVAHDWLELGMASNLGLQNPVVQMVHGNYEYYYDLAKKHEQSIDQFITVSPIIYDKLSCTLPDRKADINYCRFPVPPIKAIDKENEILKLFYCVRNLADDNKQFKILPLINAHLRSKGLNVHWTIIGSGIEKNAVENLMQQEKGISLFPSLSNKEVIELLPDHDVFILPSLLEGFPVAVVEAMKGGLVPLVTNWDTATEELIIEGETGYYFEPGNTDGYAERIAILNADRKLLRQLSANGIKKANELFDPFVNTKKIEELINCAATSLNKNKPAKKVYGSRLDELWIPNFITTFLR